MKKTEIKKEMSSRYPKPFVEMLDQAGIINRLKQSDEEGAILVRPALLSDVNKLLPLYEDLNGKICELAFTWQCN